MLVKKINPKWRPSENRGLNVGEVIDITDPTELIKSGFVVAYDPETGEEKGSWELYGVMSQKDKEEFDNFKKMQRQQKIQKQLNEKLEEENALNESLKARVAEIKKETTTVKDNKSKKTK